MAPRERLGQDIDDLLDELVRRSWLIYAFGDRAEPTALASVSRGPHWADVIVLRGHDRAAAYRALVRPSDDPLLAEWVVWHYLAKPAWTIRAALTIPPHTLSQRPYRIPPECRVPEMDTRPVIIRAGGLFAARRR